MPVSRLSLRRTISRLCCHYRVQSSCGKPIQEHAAPAHRGPSLFFRSTSSRNQPGEGTEVRHGELFGGLLPRTSDAADLIRTRSSFPLSHRQTAPYVALCGCAVTIVSEASPHCAQSGPVSPVSCRHPTPSPPVRLHLAPTPTFP